MPSVKTTDRLIHLEKLLKMLEEDCIRVCSLINKPIVNSEKGTICDKAGFTGEDCKKCMFSRATKASEGIQSTIDTLEVLGE